ncbi:MAG: hypothetical protein KGQ86_01240 [Bacteroidetes bacterium]|jgi:hypothetical protein|nr:hypothetical protein [Bacteroidota bacterium]
MKNLTLKFYLLLAIFLLLFVSAMTSDDIIRTNLLAGMSLFLFIGGMSALNKKSTNNG